MIKSKPEPLSGHLKKLGQKGFVTFKERYFLQNGEKLLYFKSKKDSIAEHLGFIDLQKILGISLSTKYDQAFEIKTSNRTYILQVYDKSEHGINEWVENIKAWMAWISNANLRKMKRKNIRKADEDIDKQSNNQVSRQPTMHQQNIYSEYQIKNTKPSRNITMDDIKEITQKIESMKKIISEEDVKIRNLNEHLQYLKSRIERFDVAPEEVLEARKQEFIATVEKNQDILNDKRRELKDIDKQLIICEKESDEANLKLLLSKESLLYRKELLNQLNEIIEIEKKTLSDKEMIISNKKNNIFASDVGMDLLGDEYYQRLEELFNNITAQQLENEKLIRIARLKEANQKARISSLTTTIETIKSNYEAKEKAYKMFLDELSKEYGFDKKILEEVENIKKMLFFTTALSVKLRGELSGYKPAEIDVKDIYLKALNECESYKEWHDYILENYFPNIQHN